VQWTQGANGLARQAQIHDQLPTYESYILIDELVLVFAQNGLKTSGFLQRSDLILAGFSRIR
jgi:hypothetical protein